MEIVDAFRAVAPVVEAFAREHELLIERYRRGKAAWELRFERQLGGEAVITISYRERTGHVLDISATWWIDDREQATRRLRSEKVAIDELDARGQLARRRRVRDCDRQDFFGQRGSNRSLDVGRGFCDRLLRVHVEVAQGCDRHHVERVQLRAERAQRRDQALGLVHILAAVDRL